MLIYKKFHTGTGAIFGLVTGSLVMTLVMILWNYLITPLYMGMPREAVAALLIPAFLPFNLLKAGLNSGIILFIYKPVVNALRKINLVESTSQSKQKKTGFTLLGLAILVTCVVIALVWTGVI